jgi:hypothetical protein
MPGSEEKKHTFTVSYRQLETLGAVRPPPTRRFGLCEMPRPHLHVVVIMIIYFFLGGHNFAQPCVKKAITNLFDCAK